MFFPNSFSYGVFANIGSGAVGDNTWAYFFYVFGKVNKLTVVVQKDKLGNSQFLMSLRAFGEGCVFGCHLKKRHVGFCYTC